MQTKLLTITETIKALGISRRLLNKLIKTNRIGFISIEKRIRIPEKEIQKFIETNTLKMDEAIQKGVIDDDPVIKFNEFASEKTNKLSTTDLFDEILKETING